MTATPGGGGSGAAKLAWGFVAIVAVLHYDFWYWDDTTLVFGFVPIGLAYQAGISLAAALGWALVVRFAWPAHLEEWADGTDGPTDGPAPPRPAGSTGLSGSPAEPRA